MAPLTGLHTLTKKPETNVAGRPVTPMERVKAQVYQMRIRMKEFLTDYDTLRTGLVTQSQFRSALSMAGLQLDSEELDELVEDWKDPQDASERVRYMAFCDEVASVFGPSRLELAPTVDVSGYGPPLVRGNRFREVPNKDMGDREAEVEEALARLAENVRTRRIQVKPFFDDAARSSRRPKSVNRVTRACFSQALRNHVAPNDFPDRFVETLADKFEDEPGMVNYLAFANTVAPPEPSFDPYTLAP